MANRESKEPKVEAVDKQQSMTESKNTMTELVKRIKYHPETEFPEEELKEIIARKEEAIPLLINILKRVRDKPETPFVDSDYFGHIYALFLLAQFRAEEAYPIVLELLSLPDDELYGVFGDMIEAFIGPVLASICGGDVSSIKGMIENESINGYVRAEAVNALAILALDGEIGREELMAYYKGLLGTINSPDVLALLIEICINIYPGELYNEIKEAYKNDRVSIQSFERGMEAVDQAMREGKTSILAKAEKSRYLKKIDDTVGELKEWAYVASVDGGKFFDDEPFDLSDIFSEIRSKKTIINEHKIGRNDPCPCGSGKKYKKCCGK